jgi:hypothetical protein
MEKVTAVQSRGKCAHEQCLCPAPPTEEYCSDYCWEADDVAEVTLQCRCGHPSCGLE